MMVRRLVFGLTALLIGLGMVLVPAPPALALPPLSSFFTYSYEAKLSQTEVKPGEPFTLSITATATCNSDLLSLANPSDASATGRIVAQHNITGEKITLWNSYTLNMPTVPSHAGKSVQRTESLTLQFTPNSPAGEYTMIGEVIEIKAIFFGKLTDLTSYLPPSTVLGSIRLAASSPPVPGGGNPPPQPTLSPTPTPSATVAAKPSIDIARFRGKITEELVVQSSDKSCQLSFRAGTLASDRSGAPLTSVTIEAVKDSHPLPEYTSLSGQVYRLGPEGAKFDKPVTITLPFSNTGGGKPAIGNLDETSGTWSLMESRVDADKGTVSAETTHLSLYAVLISRRPADFEVSSLVVNPSVASPGESISISAQVRNTGDLAASYEAVLKVDGVPKDSKDLSLEGGTAQQVAFTVTASEARAYTVSVGELEGSFSIKPVASATPQPPQPSQPSQPSSPSPSPARLSISGLTIAPAEVSPGEAVKVTTLVRNIGGQPGSLRVSLKVGGETVQARDIQLAPGGEEQVSFTISRDASGKYEVSINELQGSFTVQAPPPTLPATASSSPTSGVDRRLIGGVLAAGAALGLGGFFLARRRARRA